MSVRRGAVLALLAACACAPGPARAADLRTTLARLEYTAVGGGMAGILPQGSTLQHGPYASINVHGESALGMQVGLEFTYAASDDILRTHFASAGGIVRLSPMPEDYRVYVQLGAAAYRVTYDPKEPGLETPGETTRPGGSFGLGYEVWDSTHLSVGGVVSFTGVVLGRTSARSYMTVGLSVTLKPAPY